MKSRLHIFFSWWVFDIIFEVPSLWHPDIFSHVGAIVHSSITNSSSVMLCVHHDQLVSFVRDCLLFCIFSDEFGLVDTAGTGQKGFCHDR